MPSWLPMRMIVREHVADCQTGHMQDNSHVIALMPGLVLQTEQQGCV